MEDTEKANKNEIEQYKETRNESARIRREEENTIEKYVVKKCEEEAKLFYKYY